MTDDDPRATLALHGAADFGAALGLGTGRSGLQERTTRPGFDVN